jgi:hypothetical protein
MSKPKPSNATYVHLVKMHELLVKLGVVLDKATKASKPAVKGRPK